MSKKITLTVLTSLIAAAIFAEPPPVGSAAPDFSLPDAKGQAHSLSQYKGKYVVLEWFNPECPFVKKHYGTDNMCFIGKSAQMAEPFRTDLITKIPGEMPLCPNVPGRDDQNENREIFPSQQPTKSYARFAVED